MAEAALVAIVIQIKTILMSIIIVQKQRMVEILDFGMIIMAPIMEKPVLAVAVADHGPSMVQLDRLGMVDLVVLLFGCT